ncbi:MAG TPA: hypothetical protein VNT02_08315 [Burkholderiales bacterium]|nr:hypothetical protein [Burkholderiales bacterium]
MRQLGKIIGASAVVLMLGGTAVYAQSVETPYSTPEAGPSDISEAFGAAAPAQGGTLATEAGGVVEVTGDSATGLPMTPDSSPDYNRNGE